mmetsp:Transcript_36972/g.104301  ORF Transcript_36972/g.104301 Transcript_36972/m.104301 type:complete len:322 (+) Transcript_36972:94-1059(+)
MEADDLDNLIADSLGGVQSALDSERKAPAPAPPGAEAQAPASAVGDAVRELQQGPAKPEAGDGPPDEAFFSNLVKTFQDDNFQKAFAAALQGTDAAPSGSAAAAPLAGPASEAVAAKDPAPSAADASKSSGSAGDSSGSDRGVEDFLQNFLKSFDKAVGSDGNFEKGLTSLMTSMLSNDLICEPLQQIADKFEPWLRSQKGLPAPERERYESQLKKYHDILRVYKGSSDPLPDNARDEVQRLLSELHSLGEPPEEVMKQIAPKDAEDGAPNFDDFMKQMGLDSALGAADEDLVKKLSENPEELTNVMKEMAEGMSDECKQQ